MGWGGRPVHPYLDRQCSLTSLEMRHQTTVVSRVMRTCSRMLKFIAVCVTNMPDVCLDIATLCCYVVHAKVATTALSALPTFF